MKSFKRTLSTLCVLTLLLTLLALCACNFGVPTPPSPDTPPSGGTVTPPDDPSDPADPSDPTDPSDPADPSDPTDPSDPEPCAHTGGTATCKTKAVCDKCHESYGELDPNAHESDAVTYAVNSDDPSIHDLLYTCCGAVKATETHTGGEATCRAAAVCERCSTSYGSIGDHELVVVSSTAQSCTTDATVSYECRHCDHAYTETTALKTGHTVALL